jgi:hypothetical protein
MQQRSMRISYIRWTYSPVSEVLVQPLYDLS